MGLITQLTPDWEQWIVSNIARGVPLATLIEEMVKKDFDLLFATEVVARFAPEFAGLNLSQPQPQYAFPIPAGFEQHYASYQHEPSRIAANSSIVVDHHAVRVTARVGAPDVVVLENMLTAAECNELIALSQPKLKRSTIVDHQTGAEEVMDLRGSFGTYFLRSENALVACIEKRVAALLGVPAENGEGIQILKYGIGAEYKPHYDFFLPESPGSAKHLEKGGQRIATLIIYLNDVECGGETVFPEIDLNVIPRKGGAVYFSYCDSQTRLNRMTLHGGTPVIHGEKWIATIWVRQRAYI
ncbi:MAG: proline dioxygenase [Verrucomicrobiaceae bacterium]|nr:proline dioxygenase [Verrucomicrobiaceae bacterium]